MSISCLLLLACMETVVCLVDADCLCLSACCLLHEAAACRLLSQKSPMQVMLPKLSSNCVCVAACWECTGSTSCILTAAHDCLLQAALRPFPCDIPSLEHAYQHCRACWSNLHLRCAVLQSCVCQKSSDCLWWQCRPARGLMLQKLASVWTCWAAMPYPTRQLHGYASLWMSVLDCEPQS